MTKKELLRKIPSVDQLLDSAPLKELLVDNPHELVVGVIREILDELRNGILVGDKAFLDMGCDDITERIVEKTIRKTQSNLRYIINCTGVVLHTNLGRALLSESAVNAVRKASSRYTNLEFNLDTGKRGSRYSPVEGLITELTGAEAALVVNNNASAVLLSLSTLARGKEVLVSRGQLVEIGGSFRIPEVMKQSGCKLVEVGSTNKTHPGDYRRAITGETSLLLHVHTSNYRIVGFVRETTVAEMVKIGREHGMPVMCDLGSGVLVDLSAYGLDDEPTVQTVVKQGPDVVTFSGDKLLGGPQAGIIIGKQKFIDMMRKNPLNRAIRIDKMTVAALEATLREYLSGGNPLKNIPTLRMLTFSSDELQNKAEQLCRLINEGNQGTFTATVKSDNSAVGGGAMPLAELKTHVVSVRPLKITVNKLVEELRKSEPAVVGRVQDDHLLLDVRTVSTDEFNDLSIVLKKASEVVV